MSDIERDFHETWLGMVQPIEGLVVSIPVLIDKECFERHPPALQYQLQALCAPANDNARKVEVKPSDRAIQDLPRFFEELLGLTPDLWDATKGYRKDLKWAGVLPETLSFYAPEGPQTISPSLALRRQGASASVREADGEVAQAGAAYELLLWELPEAVSLDKPETATGPWEYPPCAKFERLLRAARVPVGLVSITLQPSDTVRCHYFSYAQRGEDPVLGTLNTPSSIFRACPRSVKFADVEQYSEAWPARARRTPRQPETSPRSCRAGSPSRQSSGRLIRSSNEACEEVSIFRRCCARRSR